MIPVDMLPVSWVGSSDPEPLNPVPFCGGSCHRPWLQLAATGTRLQGPPRGSRYLGHDHPVIPVLCRNQWHSARR